MTTRVFISYKSEYRDFAIRLRDKLHGWGYTTWFDQDDIPPGEVFYMAIQEGLGECDLMLGVITPEAMASRQVLAELHYGFERNYLLPLLYRQAELIYFLSILSYIDFTGSEDEGFERLQTALKANLPLHDVLPPSAPVLGDIVPPGEALREEADESVGAAPPPAAAPEPEVAAEIPMPRARRSAAAPDLAKKETEEAQPVAAGTERSTMLQKMHEFWIEGVLEPALHAGDTGLGWRLQPEAVLRHEEYGDVTLPSDADVGEIYAGMQRELLILGAPGAGKTTMLLHLAQELIDAARQDPAQPIPALFNLASWAATPEPLASWLMDRLRLKYQVPKQTARGWLDHDRLSLLLDGLDEVADDQREACVTAINTFREAHPQVDMVVCSRNEAYDSLTEKLDLRGAVLLQPLSDDVIESNVAAPELAGLRQLIEIQFTGPRDGAHTFPAQGAGGGLSRRALQRADRL